MISMAVLGIDDLVKNLDDYADETRIKMERVVFKTALFAADAAKKAVQRGPKSGRLYGTASDISKVTTKSRGYKSAEKRVHRASAPGEAPATDLGDLVRSIKVVKAANTGKSIVVYVQAGFTDKVNYAKALEYGTAKIRPRPYMWPAVRLAQKEVPRFIREELE